MAATLAFLFLPAAVESTCSATSATDFGALGIDTTTAEFTAKYDCANPADYPNNPNAGSICWKKENPPDPGDTAWMLFATTFVMLQTPATGFTQGGLVRRKNAMSIIGQSFAGVVIGCIMWYLVGYSFTFGPSDTDGLVGNFEYGGMDGVSAYSCLDGQTIPHLLYAAFQMTFALMVPVLVTGAWAEKFHFSAACLFMTIWPLLVYYPTAHWVWGGGWLFTKAERGGGVGVLDYAGGIVIHTSAGMASLVVALMLQKRRVYKTNVSQTTHNLPLTMVGVALIWVGWYSFNGGSGLRSNGQAVGALFVTQISACFAALTWAVCSKLDDGYVQVTHIGSGALAGLAGITPCSGFVEPFAGVPIGIIVGVASYFGGKAIKERFNLDDVLDVTSLQAIPGAIGSLLVGFFATNAALPCSDPVWPYLPCDEGRDDTKMGIFYGGDGQLFLWQFIAVITVAVWSSVFTYITMRVIHLVVPLDISPEFEDVGLDKSEHDERAYDLEATEDEVETTILAAKLCMAAQSGNLTEVRRLVKLGVPPKAGDVDGRTALHIAASFGHMDIVNVMVDEFGLDVNVHDTWGNTPMRDAMRGGHEEVRQWLKAHGGIINEKDADTVKLFEAAKEGDSTTMHHLLDSGVSPKQADYDGRTPLHLAAAHGALAVLEILLTHGADPSVRDRWGNLPIQDAERGRHTDCIEALQKQPGEHGYKFDPTARSDRRTSVVAAEAEASIRELLSAAEAGDLVEIRRLQKKRVDVYGSCDYDGRTALHVASGKGHAEVVRFLITNKRCNVNAQDNEDNTALKDALAAKASGSPPQEIEAVIELLKMAGATLCDADAGSVLCKAAHSGDGDKIADLVSHGTDVNIADYDGRTALHLAAANGNSALVRQLLDLGANPKIRDRYGGTALDDAQREQHDSVIRMLAGLDVSTVGRPPAAAASSTPSTQHVSRAEAIV